MFPQVGEYDNILLKEGRNAFKTLSHLSFIPCITVPYKSFIFASGNFAVVLKATDSRQQYAIRCFHTFHLDTLIRYKLLSNYLSNVHSSWKTNFQLCEDELRINGSLYPVIKMDWIEGKLINDFVTEHIHHTDVLTSLQEELISVSKSLENEKVVHGDIQHGNIIIQEFQNSISVKLIDYDGMYIPLLDSYQLKSTESGRSEYQHPSRASGTSGWKEIDRFSFWVLITAIEAVKYDKSLWNDTYNGGFNTEDNFLFSGTDFKNPSRSELFNKLLQSNHDSVRYYVNKLKGFCTLDPDQIDPVESFQSGHTRSILPKLAVVMPPKQETLIGDELKLWEQTRRTNTKESYQNFILKYPASQNLLIARTRLDTFDQNAYFHAQSLNTEESYRSYLKEFPYGNYEQQAQHQITRLEALKSRPVQPSKTTVSHKQTQKDWFQSHRTIIIGNAIIGMLIIIFIISKISTRELRTNKYEDTPVTYPINNNPPVSSPNTRQTQNQTQTDRRTPSQNQTITMPDLRGYTLENAKSILASKGIKIKKISYENSDIVKKNKVLLTVPAANSTLTQGKASVSLVIGKGPS